MPLVKISHFNLKAYRNRTHLLNNEGSLPVTQEQILYRKMKYKTLTCLLYFSFIYFPTWLDCIKTYKTV